MDKVKFREKLEALFGRAASIFNKTFKGRPPLRNNRLHYTIEGPGQISAKPNPEINFPISLKFMSDSLKKEEQYSQLKSVILDDSQISKSVNCMVGYHGEVFRFTDDDLIMGMLRVLSETSLQERGSQIGKICEDVEQFYGNDLVTNWGAVYLENVDFGRTSFNIAEDIAIKGLSQEEFLRLLNTDTSFEEKYGIHPPYHLRQPKSVVEFTFREKRLAVPYDKIEIFRPEVGKTPDMLARVKNVMHALRILLPDVLVNSPAYITRKYSPFDHWVDIRFQDSDHGMLGSVITANVLDRNELQRLFRILCKIKTRPIDNVALGRLEKYGMRQTVEDKILDIFIGIEAIVMGYICKITDIHGELRFRLSLLTARYLGGSADYQLNTYKLVKKGYDLRSEIVHGANVDKQKAEVLLGDLTKIYKKLIYKMFIDRSESKRINQDDLLFRE